MKALYRAAKACLAIDKVDEAEDAITQAMISDPSSPAFQSLKSEIAKRRDILNARNAQIAAAATKKREEERTLQLALKVFSLSPIS